MIGDWLMGLEEQATEAAYLWPRTPVGNLQAEAWRRVGASDWNLKHADCRAHNILRTLREMDENGLLRRRFTVLDLCCGDGIILMQIGREFLHAQCYGVDLLRYPEHRIAETRAGCSFYKAPLQAVVASEPPQRIDVCIMLNTFRGWDKADLPKEEHDMPQKTLNWMRRHCRFLFVTATVAQRDWLKREGFFIWTVGKGEDDSYLVCGFPCDNGRGIWTLETPKPS